ncbi:MAG: hypothetical protein ABFD50_06645 [Smithella sp.]
MNHNLLKRLCVFSLLYLVLIPFVPPAAANPAESFFEDDFDRASLGDNWTKYGYYGTNAINSGVLELTAYSVANTHTRYAYTANSYSSDFVMEVSAKGENYAAFLIGISDVSTSNSTEDIAHYIAFKRPPYYTGLVYLVYSNGGDDTVLWTSSVMQFNTLIAFVNFTLAKYGDRYIAYVNGLEVFNDFVPINFTNNEYQFSIDHYGVTDYALISYIDYFYTEFNGLNASAETSINIFTPNNIDSVVINLMSEIFRIFIDAVKAALVVGDIIADNLIDAVTTVMKIGQSVLTIIDQASTYIYSGLTTIIDKVIVAINSFNSVIDSIITSFKTYFDEDTAYGAIIRVIPLILLLSIPTLVVYYKIGEFATIPMFMFMAVVAYATSLMPLWILIVALIGCIAILMQKRAKA